MTFNLHKVCDQALKCFFSLGLIFCLFLAPFGNIAEAARTGMSGDFTKDTISVAKDLKEIISEEGDSQNPDSQEETLLLINDYISRYRNRSQINSTISFTTMQTALNSLAGHYKTFSNRPVPDKLKNRLNDELSKAEKLVLRENN